MASESMQARVNGAGRVPPAERPCVSRVARVEEA
ncbi:MAG: hypothetical protein QOK36_4180, partial [Gaiellales bacterium]|nr:hypothetical protein [Gaiellales bacterium]